VHVRIARRAVAGVVKPDEEHDEDDEETADEAEEAIEGPRAGLEPSDGEDRVNDSEDFVSEDDSESPAALERR